MIDKKYSQKEVVVEIIKEVLGSLYSPDYPMRPKFSRGHDEYVSYENKQRMNVAIELFIKKIHTGEIDRPKNKKIGSKSKNFSLGIYSTNSKSKYTSDNDLNKYAASIIFNWLNKDPRLNGGKKYDPSKEIESIFERDSIIRELRQLRGKTLDTVTAKEIYEIIEVRKKQLLSYEGNLYLVSKCITNEALRNLFKNLMMTNHDTKEPLLSMNVLKDVESIIIKIIDICKNEIVHEVQSEVDKKSA